MTDLCRREFMAVTGCAALAVLLPPVATAHPMVRYRFEHSSGDWTEGRGRLTTFEKMKKSHAGYDVVFLELA